MMSLYCVKQCRITTYAELAGLCSLTKEMPSVRYVLGTIHRLRQHFFRYFLQPPSPMSAFFCSYLSALFPQFLTPIPLKSADVLYGWPLAGLNVSEWEWGQKSFCHIVPLAQCTVGHLYDWVWLQLQHCFFTFVIK